MHVHARLLTALLVIVGTATSAVVAAPGAVASSASLVDGAVFVIDNKAVGMSNAVKSSAHEDTDTYTNTSADASTSADTNTTTTDGDDDTPIPSQPDLDLLWAALAGSVPLCTDALARGASPNAMGMLRHERPLHLAAGNDHLHVAELLVGVGADVNAMDVARATPLDWARKAGHERLIGYLEAHGGHAGEGQLALALEQIVGAYVD